LVRLVSLTLLLFLALKLIFVVVTPLVLLFRQQNPGTRMTNIATLAASPLALVLGRG